ncbi:S53 family peptidase [Alicyclobacillus sp. ALC3]|uniref:S53 family peptidase n=1 Tax=Alicyclobacillus sp. ALC3 TaxID=2796143 RepID=UPI0023785593|nr:protease pro-enzyme activation domain-containing protein [Alicyclobacillus sp. ALC3]WDL95240.1 hypothetical protein JC200_12515 [Alicyclobacillus sp. ALC3]
MGAKSRKWPLAFTAAVATTLPVALLAAGPTASAATLLPSKDAVLPASVTQQLSQVKALDPSQSYTFSVILPSKNWAGLQAFDASASNPKSPNYRKFLSAAQVQQQFGADPALVKSTETRLQNAGFQTKVSGQVIHVTGTVAQVNALFKTQMVKYKTPKNVSIIAPKNGVANVPSWLRQAATFTGLVATPPQVGAVHTALHQVRYTTKQQLEPTPVGATATATNGKGMSVTVKRVTVGLRLPGEAVRYEITATLNGQPDAIWPYYTGAGVVNVQGPYAGADPTWNWYPSTETNKILFDYTLSQTQTVSLAITVQDVSGNKTTIQLPAATFFGPAAKTTRASSLFGPTDTKTIVAPWNPASNNVNVAMNATQLAGQEAATASGDGTYQMYNPTTGQTETYHKGAPTIGIYTAGGIGTSSSNISFAATENDANLFAKQFHLTPETFHTAYVGPHSYYQNTYGGIQGEMSLDLQMVESSAPGANIDVYSAAAMPNALNQVVQQDAVSVFSLSYGVGEQVINQLSPGYYQSWNQLAAEANAEGITISVSAGDSGAYSGAQLLGYYGVTPSVALAAQPSFPADSGYVTSLGGTENSVGVNGHVTQSALWGGNLGAEISHSDLLSYLESGNMMGSGGISTFNTAPWYEMLMNRNLPGAISPDVSLPASVITPGYFGYFNGVPNLSGGTSASAPLFAGYMGDIAGHYGRVGNVNPALYLLAANESPWMPFGNVTAPVAFGNNGAYSVTRADNAATGLGQFQPDAFSSQLLGAGGFFR